MSFVISKQSKAMCSIRSNSESTRASNILKKYIEQITGAQIDIISDDSNSNIIFELDNKYGKNGFYYAQQGNNIVIKAENEQAFVYAVYDLLERIVGCRYYSKSYEYIPEDVNLAIQVDEYSYIPKVDYREIYYKEFEDKEFAEKHKMAQSEVHEGWGFWCHSFGQLLPKDKYFKEHPEYFALIDGERNPKGEPCLSNPEVRKIMIDNLAKYIEEKPECRFWSVSQNDDANYCRCEECQKLVDKDDSQMGPILNFVNEVAEHFPDKVISTLAYWYSRKPPKVTRPNDNVHIMVCNIEANRGLPIDTDPESKGSKEEYLSWADISGNVSLWDYNIQFRNLVSPFPNLRTLGPNMRFFVDNNLKLLFSQCNREIGGEFHELRGYMLAKLAWDCTRDTDQLIEEFCEGYYKEASPYIIEYINKMHDVQEQKNERLDIFYGPTHAKDTYLTKELYDEYSRLFDKAEETINNCDDEGLLTRVEMARLPLYYAGIVLQYGSKEERVEAIIKFANIARKTDLKMVEEWRITVDQFITDSMAELA